MPAPTFPTFNPAKAGTEGHMEFKAWLQKVIAIICSFNAMPRQDVLDGLHDSDHDDFNSLSDYEDEDQEKFAQTGGSLLACLEGPAVDV